MRFNTLPLLFLASAGSLAAPLGQFLNLAQLSAGQNNFYFSVKDLVTHAASNKSQSNDQDSVSFTVSDENYSGPNRTAHCTISWNPNGGAYDYFNPTYNFCDGEAWGFRINNGTLKDIETFELEIQHTYMTNQSAPWSYTYFAILDTSSDIFKCRTHHDGTNCKQTGGPARANITAAIG
ncbi:hypothetical protein ANO11243_011280 [Dothideomycetidae sp. 11243]|nr:hypothetical protein ANO11243_011280 [fungal sp. No.11243]